MRSLIEKQKDQHIELVLKVEITNYKVKQRSIQNFHVGSTDFWGWEDRSVDFCVVFEDH